MLAQLKMKLLQGLKNITMQVMVGENSQLQQMIGN